MTVLYLVVLLFGVQVFGHSYMSQPASRTDQAYSKEGCRVDSPSTYGSQITNCPGPCDDSGGNYVSQTNPYPKQRGAVIDFRWARNNHPGGFLRFAWAPSTATTNAAFDQYAYRYECFEKGPLCAPASSTSTADASTDTQTGCGSNITVPDWVTDGTWTFQWAWFGGYDILGDYYSCANYVVSGGSAVNPSDTTFGSPSSPVFAGGDYANPNAQQCQFRNTDRLHVCTEEDCQAPIYTAGAEQNGVPLQPDGTAVTKVASIWPVENVPSPSSGSSNAPIPCSNSTQCPSGICDVSGFCFSKSSKKLDAGGIAALFFAFLFVVLIAGAVVFAVINRSEWANWKPFNKATFTFGAK